MPWFIGIDIGSRTSKGVLTSNGDLKAYQLIPSGTDYRRVAQKLREELLAKVGLLPEDIAGIATTGQGASSIPFSNQHVADIRCCGRGINHVFPSVRTVIDIQGQSSNVIQISEKGQVINFATSEKCASGSGRFLEIIANIFQLDLKDIGPLSLKSKNPASFTTGCAVFGESEAISRISEGIPKEDILAGVHKMLADKVSTLVSKVRLEKPCAISGGGGLNVGLIKWVEDKLGVQLLVPPQPQLINALGAAIIAGQKTTN